MEGARPAPGAAQKILAAQKKAFVIKQMAGGAEHLMRVSADLADLLNRALRRYRGKEAALGRARKVKEHLDNLLKMEVNKNSDVNRFFAALQRLCNHHKEKWLEGDRAAEELTEGLHIDAADDKPDTNAIERTKLLQQTLIWKSRPMSSNALDSYEMVESFFGALERVFNDLGLPTLLNCNPSTIHNRAKARTSREESWFYFNGILVHWIDGELYDKFGKYVEHRAGDLLG